MIFSKSIFLTRIILLCFVLLFFQDLQAQFGNERQWSSDGYSYFEVDEKGAIVKIDTRDENKQEIFLSLAQLTPEGGQTLQVKHFSLSQDRQKILLNTNTKRIWRYDTRGDYWVFDRKTRQLKQLGKGKPESSLMFAKFSPDARKVAYVSEHNLYVEDLQCGKIIPLTSDGTSRLINGTFDWVYEEEFSCRDGFRWSPDGKNIAYWQLDARKIKNYLMINNTDSLYPFTIPVEYPVVGEDPSSCRIGVVAVSGGVTKWMKIPGSSIQNYIPRMEWVNPNQLIVQQLNRRQNVSKIMFCNVADADASVIHQETETTWIDIKDRWNNGDPSGWDWLNGGSEFLWVSEKEGWRHIYAIDRNGHERLITKGNYDIISIVRLDTINNQVYFMASPDNATEAYLYHCSLSGKTAAQRLSPSSQKGVHEYEISPNGKIALHSYSNVNLFPVQQVVSLPEHKVLSEVKDRHQIKKLKIEFFKVSTEDSVEMDGWLVKPTNFDPKKKYPVVFYVYGEPAAQTVLNSFGVGYNRLYEGNMADDGYIYLSVEGRGAPAPKGREWRKSIYHRIGDINIRDQAMAAKEILKWNFVDSSRVAVWGWSGGGSSTLNLLFQYPEIYKTGISIAAVDNQLNYDNIYQERYMGLLPEDKHYFVDNSPLAHAKNLKGNLLLIHGTGDDNVHYNNAEQMINELVRYNKTFQLMSYPNRSHSLSEGEGTTAHLKSLFTSFLKENCPPGGR